MSRVMCRQGGRARRRQRWLQGGRREQDGQLLAVTTAVYVPIVCCLLFGQRVRWPGVAELPAARGTQELRSERRSLVAMRPLRMGAVGVAAEPVIGPARFP